MKKNIFLLSMIFFGAVVFYSCNNSNASKSIANQEVDKPEQSAPKPAEKQEQKETLAKIHTEYGDIIVKLYNGTPKHRDNFIKLADSGYYNGTLFHRVIQHFMIQGGDPDSKGAPAGVMLGNGDPGYTIPAEIMPDKYFHKRGALAAARLGDNVNPTRASSGSQFYIVQGQVFNDTLLDFYEQKMGVKFTPQQRKAYTTVGGAPHLDGGYTVFGEVVKGMDVVDKIAAVKTDKNDRPLKDIKMDISIIKTDNEK